MNGEVLKTVENYIRSIHTQNRDDFDNVWSGNGECTLISITKVYNGRESIFNDFYGALRNAYSVIDLINDGIEINMADEHTAIAVFRYHTECIKRDTGEAFGIKGLETQVIVKEDGRWKLRHVHYSK